MESGSSATIASREVCSSEAWTGSTPCEGDKNLNPDGPRLIRERPQLESLVKTKGYLDENEALEGTGVFLETSPNLCVFDNGLEQLLKSSVFIDFMIRRLEFTNKS